MSVRVVKIYKSYGGRSNKGQWSNSYLVDGPADLSSPDWVTTIGPIVAFEKAFHLTQVFFMRAVVSTPEKEPAGQRADKFRVFELGGTGAIASAVNTTMALDVCLAVKKQTALGSPGIELYRGALGEADVEGGQTGGFLLTEGRDGAFIIAKGGLFAALPVPTFYMGKPKDSLVASYRVVSDMVISGVVIKKKTHRRKKVQAIKNYGDALDNLKFAISTVADFYKWYTLNRALLSPVQAAELAATETMLEAGVDAVKGALPPPA